MSVIDRLVSIYAPHACASCSVEGFVLCPECRLRLPVLSARCYRCMEPSAGGRLCPVCRPGSALISVNTVGSYSDSRIKEVLNVLKFGRAMAAADDIGYMMAERFGESIAADVLIVPVPTARTRVRGRGYDQAALIARSLAWQSDGTYAPLLMRLGSKEQKGADRRHRERQLRGAYMIRDPQRVQGARILLVDDVLTTGSTLEEVASTLKDGGAKVVGALVFARA